MEGAKKKCLQVLDYIENIKSQKSNPETNIPTAVFLAAGYKPEKFITVFSDDSEDDSLVCIERGQSFNPPTPAEGIRELIGVVNNMDKPPSIPEKMLKNDEVSMTQKNMYEKYLVLWNAWAEKEKENQAHNQTYKRWFDIAQRLKEDGEAENKEIVCGIGLALASKDGRTLSYPLIFQPCEISVQQKEPYTITITSALAPAKVHLAACSAFGFSAEQIAALEKKYNESHALDEIHPFDPESYRAVLQDIAARLDAKAQVVSSYPDIGQNLMVLESWVLFERQRPTDRILEDIRRLRDSLNKGAEIPPAALRLLGINNPQSNPSNVAFLGIDPITDDSEVKQLYFPLAYNDEQVDVIRKLEQSDGVVVQGPPGTGKSHTIANVISHYLSEGKRVLVTSSSAHALDVVQEKIPEDIRGLSVPLLSSDATAVRDIEKSLGHINEKINRARAEHVKRQQLQDIEVAQNEILAVSEEINIKKDQIKDLYISNTNTFDIENGLLPQGDKHSALVLCQTVADLREECGWLQEDVPALFGVSVPLVLSKEQHQLLCALKEKMGQDVRRSNEKFPYSISRQERPSQKFVASIWSAYQHYPKIDKYEKTRANLLSLSQAQDLQDLHEKATNLLSAWAQWDVCHNNLQQTIHCQSDGIEPIKITGHQLMLNVVKDDNKPLKEELLKFSAYVEKTFHQYQELDKRVKINELWFSDPAFCEAVEKKAQENGVSKILNMFSIGSDTKSKLSQISIDGSEPQTNEQWLFIDRYKGVLSHAQKIRKYWAHFSKQMSISSNLPRSNIQMMEFLSDALQKIGQSLHAADTFVQMTDHAHATILQMYQHHIIDQIWDPQDWTRNVDDHRRESVRQKIEEMKEIVEYKMQYDVLKNECDERYLSHYKTNNPSAISHKVIQFLDQPDISVSQEEFLEKWGQIEDEIEHLISLQEDFQQWNDIIDVLATQCPQLAKRYTQGEEIQSYDKLRKAWDWAQLNALTQTIDEHVSFEKLYAELSDLKLQKTKQELNMIKHNAWRSVTENVTEEQSQALSSYISAIGRIGKTGKGKRAARHRRTAQESMRKCYSLVPCWIMPIERVSEDMPPEMGLFDLVIVDEASQANITAFLALVRGKKILIVGDDKQVSPSVAGMDEEKLVTQANKILDGIEHKNEMLPDHSIYDLCNTVFAKYRIMLKEHFRCVAPIIEYSNREYYNDKIIPLRNPPADQMLLPALVDVFVANGAQNSQRNENEAEAEYIVQEILSILKDEQLKDKTIGVVTLNSNEKQSLLITKKISQRVSEKDRIERHISVGTPPMFQGKERDLILLSGYYDRINGLFNKSDIKQRINVAASRARDRMYLFRSVPDNEVRPDTLFGGLINHFKNPQPRLNELNDMSPAATDLEKDIATYLLSKGYDIRLHAGPGSYDIDIVVYGSNGQKLAIQCDGDSTHPYAQEHWLQSLKEQQVLEKVGWVFWRCFAANFVLHKEQLLQDLLACLQQTGVLTGEHKKEKAVFEHKKVGLPKATQTATTASPFDDMFSGEDLKPKALISKDLKKLTFHDDPPRSVLRQRCENDFEKKVFDEMTSRGYRIHPQYEFSGYRLDMIAWDKDGNCAVLECDGDTFHDMKVADKDNNRENFLSKNGFRFVRFYYSEMAQDPESLWERVSQELSAFGVENDS